ncbi:hypothetical protein ABPG72_018128 [Tetrahymena utriculariae]
MSPKAKNGIQKFIGRNYQTSALFISQIHQLCKACGYNRLDNFRHEDDKTATYICRDCHKKWNVDKEQSQQKLEKEKNNNLKKENQINKNPLIQNQIDSQQTNKKAQNSKVYDINLQEKKISSNKLHVCSKCGCDRQDNFRLQKENICTCICRNTDCEKKWMINLKI